MSVYSSKYERKREEQDTSVFVTTREREIRGEKVRIRYRKKRERRYRGRGRKMVLTSQVRRRRLTAGLSSPKTTARNDSRSCCCLHLKQNPADS